MRQFQWDLNFSRAKRWKREQDRGVEVVADEEGKVGSLDGGRRVKLTRVSLVHLLDFPWEKKKKKKERGEVHLEVRRRFLRGLKSDGRKNEWVERCGRKRERVGETAECSKILKAELKLY